MPRVLISNAELLCLYPAGLEAFDQVLCVETTQREVVERQFGRVQATEVWGFGGGQAIDVAKLVGARSECKVVAYPSIISTDAFLVPDSAVREDGTVRYLRTKKPDEVKIDYDLLLRAPARMNAAGWADVFSIYTGAWDWRLAHEQLGEPYDPALAQAAGALLQRACPPTSREGLTTLIDCLAAEVSLCERWGNSRPEEGSEHFFVYCLENHLPGGAKYLHGELVALGILEMARRQGQDVRSVKGLMQRVGLLCSAAEIGVPQEAIIRTLAELPDFVKRVGLPYSIINQSAEQARA